VAHNRAHGGRSGPGGSGPDAAIEEGSGSRPRGGARRPVSNASPRSCSTATSSSSMSSSSGARATPEHGTDRALATLMARGELPGGRGRGFVPLLLSAMLMLASLAWAAPVRADCPSIGFCFQPDRLSATSGSVVSATIVGACPNGQPVRLEFVGPAVSKTAAVTADSGATEGSFTFAVPHLPPDTYELWLLCNGLPQSDLGRFEVTSGPPETATEPTRAGSDVATRTLVLALAGLLGAAVWLPWRRSRRSVASSTTQRTDRGGAV
jgi:hypothetical protein